MGHSRNGVEGSDAQELFDEEVVLWVYGDQLEDILVVDSKRPAGCPDVSPHYDGTLEHFGV